MDLDARIKEFTSFKTLVLSTIPGGEATLRRAASQLRASDSSEIDLGARAERRGPAIDEEVLGDIRKLALRLPDIEQAIEDLKDLKKHVSELGDAVAALQQGHEAHETAIAGLGSPTGEPEAETGTEAPAEDKTDA